MMKNQFSKLGVLAILCASNLVCKNTVYAAPMQEKVVNADKKIKNSYPTLVINGTNASQEFSVSIKDLDPSQDVVLTAPAGFSVSPATIPANTKSAKVTVKLTSSKKFSEGLLVIRSGDTRSFINLEGHGSALPNKDILASPVYKGGQDAKFVKTSSEGFKPTEKGYTVEFKVNTSDDGKEFFPYLVNGKGIGFKGYIDNQGLGLFSSTNKKDISNPMTRQEGGLAKFYNNDGKPHTYRYAVASDDRVFVFRDGIALDTLRAKDFGPQDFFASENGDPVENLLKNSGFEEEFDISYDNNMATKIEGWDILIGDRYNSEQFIVPQEIDNAQDFNNHILKMNRYMWADGWSAAEVSQVVDVAPNENYTLQALIRGGIKKEGDLLGKMKIEEVQDNALGTSVEIASKNWEIYSLDYTTSAQCKQLRVIFYLERDKWGANITSLDIDNVKLTGRSKKYSPKIGFDNSSSKIDYFTYDLSGAYAPVKVPEINIELDGSKN